MNNARARVNRLSFMSKEVFGKPINGSSPASSNNGPLSSPTENNTGNWVDGFVSGKVSDGNATQSSKARPFTIQITNSNKATG